MSSLLKCLTVLKFYVKKKLLGMANCTQNEAWMKTDIKSKYTVWALKSLFYKLGGGCKDKHNTKWLRLKVRIKLLLFMVLCIPNFIQQTCKFIIKKIQSLESKLNIWNPSSSASMKYARNQSSLRNTIIQSSTGGAAEGCKRSTLFFHSYFSHLVWIPSSVPTLPLKNLLGVIEHK